MGEAGRRVARAMGTERRYISTLKPNESIDDIFLVRDKDLRTAANGSSYIMCTLVDRSGTLPTRMWQANEAIYKAIPVDGFMRVRGRTESYRGSLQFIIEALQRYGAIVVDRSKTPTMFAQRNANWTNVLPLNLLQDLRLKHFRAVETGQIFFDPPRSGEGTFDPTAGVASPPSTGTGSQGTIEFGDPSIDIGEVLP